nr:molecular chaperone [Lysobacter chinensis]
MQVAPTSITIRTGQVAEGLTLRNTGTAPLHAQLRVFRWHQDGGEDSLEATTDIALSPPMVEIAPGGRQLVRVVRTAPPPVDVETGYRIIVDEIPVARDGDGQEPSPQAGLRFVMRYSIPLFLAPPQPDAPMPSLHAHVVGDGRERFIEIRNDGQGHAQVADLAFVGADGRRTVVAPGLSGYVLPGRNRRWKLPERLDSPLDGAFKARINGESVERTLAMDAEAR